MRDVWLSMHTSIRFASTAFHVDYKLIRVQVTLNKSTKLATGLCHEHDGPLTAQREIVSSWTDVNSRQTMTALRCCVTWYARRWGDTCTSTTVVANHTTIPKSYILTTEWSQTPTKRRTGSRTVSTGAARVSPPCDLRMYCFSAIS